MFKLFIVIYIFNTPIGEIKTDLLFETHKKCMEHVTVAWDGYTIDQRVSMFPDCRIEH